MKLAQFLLFLSIVSVMGLLLALLQLTHRPLCIDSKIVEKMERYSNDESETIYRCSAFKEIPFSEFFSRHSNWLASEINKSFSVLESIAPFMDKIRITLFQDREFERVQFNQIFLGEKILFKPGVLQKNISRVWMHGRFNPKNESLFFLEDVLVDFLSFLAEGRSIQDTETRNTIVSDKSYQQIYSFKDNLYESMVQTFLSFSLMERELFLHGFSYYLVKLEENRNFDSLKIYRDQSALSDFWTASFLEVKLEPFANVYVKFAKILSETIQEGSRKSDSDRLNFFKFNQLFWWLSLENIKPYKNSKIGFNFGQLNLSSWANQIIAFSCKNPTFAELNRFRAFTERLVLVNVCLDPGQISQFNWTWMENSKFLDFSTAYPNISFAVFHLPSFYSAIEDLEKSHFNSDMDVFECLKKEVQSEPTAARLNIEKLKNNSDSCHLAQFFGWNTTSPDHLQANKLNLPKALNEGIQVFKVIN